MFYYNATSNGTPPVLAAVPHPLPQILIFALYMDDCAACQAKRRQASEEAVLPPFVFLRALRGERIPPAKSYLPTVKRQPSIVPIQNPKLKTGSFLFELFRRNEWQMQFKAPTSGFKSLLTSCSSTSGGTRRKRESRHFPHFRRSISPYPSSFSASGNQPLTTEHR